MRRSYRARWRPVPAPRGSASGARAVVYSAEEEVTFRPFWRARATIPDWSRMRRVAGPGCGGRAA